MNQQTYDNASRTTQTVEDVGGLARTTNYTWTLDNQSATMTAVNSTTGNQTTTWAHGVTLPPSQVARADLLASITFPDSGVLAYRYNRLGQKRVFFDQRGNERGFTYDGLGRISTDFLALEGIDTDATVKQIAWTYEIRGMVQTITSTDAFSTVLNQVQLNYNTFAQLSQEYQEHSGAVNTSTSASVQYAYDTGGSSSNEIRLNQLTYPNLRTIAYYFGTSGGMNDLLNRVDTIQDTTSGTTDLASYTYLGMGTVVRIAYPQPAVWLDLWGGTSGVFAGLDLFNRVIDQRWQNNTGGTPVDIDRYKYGYDLNSNRQYKANVVGTANVAAGLDEYYTMDNLNRLTDMQRGVLNSSVPPTGITGTIAREMTYGLDPTGNWSTYVTATAGTTDLNQGRVANTVNEITSITESGGTPLWVTPAYDPAGNMTTMPQPGTPTSSFTALYDAWGRMTVVDSGSSPVGQYQYDGRHRRIVAVTTQTRHFYFTNSWQDIEQRVGSATTMDQQHVWGLRYIDELVCRDDATPDRLYATQDANFNLTAIVDTSGVPQEYYYFDPYGIRTILNSSWSVVGASAYSCVLGRQGLLYDISSGLVYNRTRVLHPLLGVFLGRDPLAYADGPSLYEYLRSAPTKHLDPFGRTATCADAERCFARCVKFYIYCQSCKDADPSCETTVRNCLSGCQSNGVAVNSVALKHCPPPPPPPPPPCSKPEEESVAQTVGPHLAGVAGEQAAAAAVRTAGEEGGGALIGSAATFAGGLEAMPDAVRTGLAVAAAKYFAANNTIGDFACDPGYVGTLVIATPAANLPAMLNLIATNRTPLPYTFG